MTKKIEDLISQASEKMGNSSRLAERLDVPRAMVSMWKTGKKSCPAEEQARIGAILGLNPVTELIRAILEKHEGTKKGEELRELLKK